MYSDEDQAMLEAFLSMDKEEMLRVADEEVAMIALSQGQNNEGQPRWSYVLVPPSKYEAFCAAKGPIRLNDYGEVIASGDGVEPPAEVVAQMAERYGADETIEEDLVNNMQKLKKEYELRKKFNIK